MRKMYFAMIPQKSALEQIVVTAGVAAGVIFGAKKLLGEEKFNAYKDKIKDTITNAGVKEDNFSETIVGDDFTVEEVGEPTEKKQEDILERIRRAGAKGAEKILDKIG